jgi:hypothetical protein
MSDPWPDGPAYRLTCPDFGLWVVGGMVIATIMIEVFG